MSVLKCNLILPCCIFLTLNRTVISWRPTWPFHRQILCLSKGNCTAVGECKQEQRPPPPSGFNCPPGHSLCLDTGTCAFEGACGGSDNLDWKESRDSTACPPGQVFCLATGTCSFSCGGKGDKEEGFGKDTSCPFGLIFCLETGTCSPAKECGGERPPDLIEGFAGCPFGQIFCLETGACSPAEECGGKSPSDLSQDFAECPFGQILCLETGQCTLEDECGGSRGPPDRSQPTACPPGLVFCLSVGDCVPERACQPVTDESSSSKDFKICPSGKVRTRRMLGNQYMKNARVNWSMII